MERPGRQLLCWIKSRIWTNRITAQEQFNIHLDSTMHQCLMHKHIQRANKAPKPGNSHISPTQVVPEQALTWGVLGSGKWGHGVGEVEVCSDAELALHRRRIWRCGGQERFFTGFLINSRQIRVNQGIKELHYELSIVWDLGLLWETGGKNDCFFHCTFLEVPLTFSAHW